MRFSSSLNYALSGSAVLALLAGCSGGGSSLSQAPAVPGSQSALTRSASSVVRQSQSTSVLRPGLAKFATPLRMPGFSHAVPGSAYVIVSDAVNYVIDVFTTAGVLTSQITGLTQPQGLAADPAGDLYVANTGASNILLYKNDYSTLLATLNDANQYPVGVGFDSHTGVVGVTNIISTAGGAGSVSMYAKGSTTPCATVSSASFGRVYFGAFGKYGWFYVDGQDPSGNAIEGVVKGQCSATTIDSLTVSNGISFPGGIELTPANKVVIDDQLGATLYTYNLPNNHSLGSPIASTSISGSSDPVTFSFTQNASDVWTADAGLAESLEFKYPTGGSAISTIAIPNFGQPIGVVVTPPETPPSE